MISTSIFLSIIIIFAMTPKAASAMATSSKDPTTKSYDMIVVGGGSAGLTAAKLGAGTLKKSVLLIEQSKLGGDCTWTGCVPSKSLLARAKAAKLARSKILQLSSSTSSAIVDWNTVKGYYTQTQQEIFEQDDSAEALLKFNVDTLLGKATLTSSNTLTVTLPDSGSKRIELTAEQGIILCTGASPRRPDNAMIAGLSDVDYMTYEEFWEMDTLPERITIVGGGPIGKSVRSDFSSQEGVLHRRKSRTHFLPLIHLIVVLPHKDVNWHKLWLD
jgi:pyruvate/2-oxoglutarate dehydrogenase complex dihydrolipoamide dehydrogenase (E3) component